jgi:hypothetical protein
MLVIARQTFDKIGHTDAAAEAATGNREFYLNKPHSLEGCAGSGDVP